MMPQQAMPSSQRGIGFFSFLIVLACTVVLGGLVFRLLPLYLDDRVIHGVISNTLTGNDGASLNLDEIRSQVDRNLKINGIMAFDVSNIRQRRNNGRDVIEVDYEARVDLIHNIDAVLSFSHRFER